MPQPIDPHTEFARVTMAERIQALADRTTLVAQNRHTLEAEEALLRAEQQVAEPEQKGEDLDTELRRRNPYRRRRRKPAEEDETARTVYGADERPHRLDADEGGATLDVTV